jgi:hypothetical protein
VTARDEVQILLKPTTVAPRRDPKRRSRLVDEHTRRQGDPVAGGGSRNPIMTAYRQEALACAAALADGPKRPRDLRSGMPNAYKILRRNVYGWFVSLERGIYALTPAGHEALKRWPQHPAGVEADGQRASASSSPIGVLAEA